MSDDFRIKATACCRQERDRIGGELAKCERPGKADYKHRCYRVVARKSGRRAKQCMLA